MLVFKNILCISFATTLFLLTTCVDLFAQKKLEREYRIKEQYIPQQAINFIKNCFQDAKIKWYGEESLQGKTLEAKIKLNRNSFSIEFDTLGNLIDVELLIDFNSIDLEIRNTINTSFSNQFNKYKIMRCQVQWLGTNEALRELIAKGETGLPYQTNYEIVLEGKSDEGTEFYESLFDNRGIVLKSSVIVQRNTNNLFY